MGSLLQGGPIWALGPGPTLQVSSPDLPSLASVHGLCAAAFQHRWLHWGELALGGKREKRKVHPIPGSHGWGGHSMLQESRIGGCPSPPRNQSLLLMCPPGILVTLQPVLPI